MKKLKHFLRKLKLWAILLRWNKPSGRFILLIPAGWALWLTPSSPPSLQLIRLIVLGAICTSGAGCIANDLWDRKIDSKVERTKSRPLASGEINIFTAWGLLITTLFLSLLVVLSLPIANQTICLILACASLIPILIYPSSKRWFKYPQALLAICWGFAVLIPWAASEGSLKGGLTLLTCWMATLFWTFGFDTVYAMADMNDDQKLGLNSSAISLGANATNVVMICYVLTAILIGISAFNAKVNFVFWPIWLGSGIGMQREIILLNKLDSKMSTFNRHFKHQVLLGALMLLGLILGKTT